MMNSIKHAWSALTCIAFFIGALAPNTSAQSFFCRFPGRMFPTGSSPLAMETADIDGDNDFDLLVVNEAKSTVTILINECPAQFSHGQSISVGEGARSIAIGDLDGDGDSDFATANFDDNTISVVINNSDGTFARSIEYPAGAGTRTVAVGDLNQDGHLDIAAANAGDNNVSIFLNQGDGTYSNDNKFPAGPTARSIALGDLNGDGFIDIAVGNAAAPSVSVLINTGNADFGPPSSFAAGGNVRSVDLGDLDEDGDLDIVTANSFSNNISVLKNLSNGTFASPVNYATGQGPIFAAIGDIDNNPDLEIVSANSGDATVTVFRNSGDGTLNSHETLMVGRAPNAIVIKDFERDGRNDIAVANSIDDHVMLIRNVRFQPLVGIDQIESAQLVAEFEAVDIDGNGLDELLSTSLVTGELSIHSGLGCTNRSQQTIALAGIPTQLAIGDLNNDQMPDVAVAQNALSDIQVLFNTPAGLQAPMIIAGGLAINDLAVADVDSDGLADLITASQNVNTVSILFSLGNQVFAPPITISVDNPARIIAADIDGDADQDIIAWQQTLPGLVFAINDGIGNFQTVEVNSTAPTDLLVSDLDNNGISEILILDSGASQFIVAAFDTINGLEILKTVSTPSTPGKFRAFDYELDGLPDLVITNPNDDSVSFFRNQGSFDFQFTQTSFSGTNPIALAVGNFDCNEFLDTASVNFNDNTITLLYSQCVFLGDTNGCGPVDLLDVAPFIEILSSGEYQMVADMDRNGKVDLLDVQAFVEAVLGN